MANGMGQNLHGPARATATVLVNHAAAIGVTITYGAILDKMGIKESRGAHSRLASELNMINAFCVGIGIPLLSSVATKASGKPGKGFFDWTKDVDAARAAVFAFDWSAVSFG